MAPIYTAVFQGRSIGCRGAGRGHRRFRERL